MLSKATTIANLEFVEWLDGRTEYMPRVGGTAALDEPIQLSHTLTKANYTALAEALKLRSLGREYDPEAINAGRESDVFKLTGQKGVRGLAPEFQTPRF